MRRIGYAKVGRMLGFVEEKFGPQGDAEAPQLLDRLARRNPDVEWWVIGKNNAADNDVQLRDNVINPWAPGVMRAPWAPTSDGVWACSSCKTPITAESRSSCCERGSTARAYEEYIIELCRSGYLDGLVIHVGQHGTSSTPIPEVTGEGWADPKRTNPQAWTRNYGGYLVEALNAMGDRSDGRAPVVWICADPRNYFKGRDVKWPTGLDRIIGQSDYRREGKHERFQDPRRPDELGFKAKTARHGELWLIEQHYIHADAELMILPDDWETWGAKDFHDREHMGIASTATWIAKAQWRRSWMLQKFVLDTFPTTPVYGRWDDKSVGDLKDPSVLRQNTVAEFPGLLGSWRVTASLPPSTRFKGGEEWSVAKPYQCFAARVACMFIGSVDKQGAVIPSRHKTAVSKQVAPGFFSYRDDWTADDVALAKWLRVNTPDEYAERVRIIATDPDVWSWVVGAQRALLSRRWAQANLEATIEQQLGIRNDKET